MIRRAAVSLGYLMELVAALALGFAASRWPRSDSQVVMFRQHTIATFWLPTVINPFLQSLAVAGLMGLVIERIMGRRAGGFGLGRWAWTVTGLYVAVHLGRELIMWKIGGQTFNNDIAITASMARWLRYRLAFGSGGGLATSLLAVWFGLALARTPGDPTSDAREWSGRLFGAAVILWAMVLPVMKYFSL